MFWNCKLQNLGLNHHLSTYLALKGYYIHTKGCLIRNYFVFGPIDNKRCQITPLEFSAQRSDLPPFVGNGTKVKISSEINPPLDIVLDLDPKWPLRKIKDYLWVELISTQQVGKLNNRFLRERGMASNQKNLIHTRFFFAFSKRTQLRQP